MHRTLRSALARCLPILLALFALGLPARAEDDWPQARKRFRAAAKSPDWKVRQDAFADLAYFDGAHAVDEVLTALGRESNPAVTLTGIKTLAAFSTTPAKEALVEAARKSKGTTRLYVLMALEQQKGAVGKDLLLELVQGKDAPAAAQAALALGQKKVTEATPHLIVLLRHKDWQLRAAAARSLRWLEATEAIAPLVASLQISKGRERGDIIDALHALTKQDFGLDVPAWKDYLSGTDPTKIKRKPETVPHVFGIPIYGRRVVLILTNSLRTSDPHRFGRGSRMEELCKVPGGPPIFHMRIGTVGQFAQAHFRRVISDLPKDVKFELITFTATVNSLFGKLTPANGGTKKVAFATMDELKEDDGMNHFGALNAALDVSGSKDSVAWRSGPDEIVFTACNMPNHGEIKEAPVVGAAIALKARLRMVPIHTVGIETHGYEMMATIAKGSGGVYLNLYE